MRNILIFGSENTIKRFILNMNPYLLPNYKLHLLICSDSGNVVDELKKLDCCTIINAHAYLNLTSLIIKIKKLNPYSIIFLNYRSLYNYIILKIADYLRIKKIFLQHGVFDDEIPKLYSKLFYRSLIKYFKYLIIFIQLKKYTKNSLIIQILIFFDLTFKRSLKKYYKFDDAIVYSKNHVHFILKNFIVDKNSVKLSGFQLVNSRSDYLKFDKPSSHVNNIVLYIHQKNRGITDKNEVDMIIKFSETVRKLNLIFAMKLHPSVDYENYRKLIDSNSILCISDESFFQSLKNCVAVISVNSTALYLPIVLGKPIILVNIFPNIVSFCGFDEVGILLNNFIDLEEYLLNKKFLLSKIHRYSGFREKQIGYNNSFEDLAEIILKIHS
jgi:hypothetical protein